MEQEKILEIIDLYTNQGMGTHILAKKFNVGHKKISSILKENNVPIKSKGGQIKNEIDISKTKVIQYDSNRYGLKCKLTGKVIKDVNNLSGEITRHIIQTQPDVEIPKNNYQRKKYENENGKKWYEDYFDKIELEIKDTRKCSLCDWTTTDIENNTGCFEQHVKNVHNRSIYDYLIEFPNEIHLHKEVYEKQHKLNSEDSHVICEICGEKMVGITNTHLSFQHNMTISEYKLLYPNSRIVSEKTSEKLTNQIIEINKTITPTWTSKGEIELREYIESLGFNTIKGKNRKILEGKEIDIIIPELKICFEYNGLYFHTEEMGKNSTYHLNKTLDCYKLGYKLYHIFEDEWMANKEITKSKIKHLLGKGDGVRIGGRQIVIKTIDSKIKKEFLDKYHIQGNDKSTICYGGYYNDELVGVMTFNGKRNMTKTKHGEYELTRFATNNTYIISGLASKMVKHFINEHNPVSIISFADRRWTIDGDNNLYTKLGFELIKILPPEYYYYSSKFNRYKRFHKFVFGKNNLKKKYPHLDFNKSENELTKELGFSKIWNCGLYKYELRIQKD
jgi:hypothetical protein